jgi:F-type H+-transporting ATPase subunit b
MSQIEQIAQTFGVDWTHLGAQAISFAIMCAVLYRFAYGPILQMLQTRREQIAAGLVNAAKIKTELQRIEADRLKVLEKAGDEGRQLVEDARAAAARVGNEERRKATAEAEQIVSRAREAAAHERAQMLTDARREIGRLVIQTTASVAGKVLTAEDHQRLAEETASRLAAV